MARFTNVPVLHSWESVNHPTRSPRAQLKIGAVIGYARIKDVLVLASADFLKDLSVALKIYITRFFPKRRLPVASNVIAKSAGMAEDTINTISITKNAVRFSLAKSWEHRKLHAGTEMKLYAKYVEQMTGKNWNNPDTIEHPASALLTRMRIEMNAIWLRLAHLHGVI